MKDGKSSKAEKLVTIRLADKQEKQLARVQKRLGRSRSSVVREAITRYLSGQEQLEIPALERLAPWIGIVKGADPHLSENTGRKFTQLLLDARRRRSR